MVVRSDRLMTVDETAYYLNLSARKVYQMIYDGELTAYKFGSVWRLEPETVLDYAKQKQRIGRIQV
jgi:excisionase family DNA binding protein